ncbi:hypothetical protein SERLA73DRAFT_52154 [Serpula lacrymans var. lacrymans S7.3]|uniref:AAA+ ATPase domain-containing protein n=1 Tax=Serpula lacrymans var. lacrymans (strain S7.3) TaxID=936435 RepID=F8PVW0_SERL3|nr:hypothetical protein SERLA73DRAFT_52154 [Serpula lacrymans var. lacrymans S7.3]
MSFKETLDSAFAAPATNEKLKLLKCLKDVFPNSQHVAHVGRGDLLLAAYLKSVAIHVEVAHDEPTHSFFEWDVLGQGLNSQIYCGAIKFTYNGTDFTVYKVTFTKDRTIWQFFDFVFNAADDGAGRALLRAVYMWAGSLKDEIWVFQNGGWEKNAPLYQSIQLSNWENIVLENSFREGLRRDTKTFFANKEIYDSLDIAWKRGILLLGPPGNGKTETIKALLSESQQTTLYVKSFTAGFVRPENSIRAIFGHARRHSPCILVLEDLDTMITPQVRSYFLNEMDGLALNNGILTIATTNHPEDIDDAIINRPSRFDVKYTFDLPNATLRRDFALKWLSKIRARQESGVAKDSILTNDEEVARKVSEKTEGWSFAFLKELYVSDISLCVQPLTCFL